MKRSSVLYITIGILVLVSFGFALFGSKKEQFIVKYFTPDKPQGVVISGSSQTVTKNLSNRNITSLQVDGGNRAEVFQNVNCAGKAAASYTATTSNLAKPIGCIKTYNSKT